MARIWSVCFYKSLSVYCGFTVDSFSSKTTIILRGRQHCVDASCICDERCCDVLKLEAATCKSYRCVIEAALAIAAAALQPPSIFPHLAMREKVNCFVQPCEKFLITSNEWVRYSNAILVLYMVVGALHYGHEIDKSLLSSLISAHCPLPSYTVVSYAMSGTNQMAL